ncbi:Tumor protein D52 [Liparis tanakae]|uniref:Tumor protein D52 n=1 Tax=Liparis tanakae TaxID=230148 RepID=A0A4Z2FYN8_9TELE|nr:Tumor protein D52 [Liparis tanakae]
MEDAEKGSQYHPDLVPEVGEDAATSAGPFPTPPAMTEEEQQELQEALVKVEEEILTLSQVLAAKERHLADMKRKLGITPLNELKQNFSKTWQEVTTSTANAPTFKSFEGKVETLKTKMSPPASAGVPDLQDGDITSTEALISPPDDSATQETPMN